MAAGTSIITERSPYIVRTSFTLAQTTAIIADWAAKNGIKKVVTMVNDFAPGIEAETSFKGDERCDDRHGDGPKTNEMNNPSY
jgi:branched-chain amino acid transport system substrate-binding protein